MFWQVNGESQKNGDGLEGKAKRVVGRNGRSSVHQEVEAIGDVSGWKEELLWADCSRTKSKAGMENRKEVEGPLPKSQPSVAALSPW